MFSCPILRGTVTLGYLGCNIVSYKQLLKCFSFFSFELNDSEVYFITFGGVFI